MTISRLRLVAAAFIIAAGAGRAPVAQTSAPATGRETTAASVARYSLAEKMPVDPEVILGTLPNGLRYYVRQNDKPARRVELRLVVKAGSVLEDPDQLGLAHFVEHMLFEGTKNFPGSAITDYLQSMGLSIGADANASTGYDETQYILRVPSDTPGALDMALRILEDWAQNASFEQAGIDRERPIVLSEWRMNLGAGERTQDKIRRIQLEGSRYADRPPIGDPAIIQAAGRDALVRFYRDWYRPDLMAVIVVGDIDRDAVASKIRAQFSSLKSPAPARPRPAFDVPEHASTRYALVQDKETTSTVVELSNLRPSRDQGSVGGYREIMIDQLFADMLGDRLNELGHSANPPFLGAAAGRSLFQAPRTRDEAVLQALVATDGVTRGVDALVTELERVRRFGFTASELDRAKLTRLANYERVAAESPDRESASRADEYTRNFLQDEALPTIWQELAFNRRFVPEVTLADVSSRADDWFPARNRLLLVSAPEAGGVRLPTEADLAAAVRTATARRLEAYTDSAGTAALVEALPTPGSIARTVARADGITEWTLSNGATVVLKPTTLKQDQILMRAFAPGGTSLASDAEIGPARVADALIAAGGAGQFSDVTLDKMLAGKSVAVVPFIDETSQGLAGGSTPQDLETMFQLLYLRFTAPRADPAVFAAMQRQAKAALANQQASPDVVFNQAIDAVLDGTSARRAPETPQSVDRWNLDASLAFYKARFADAGHFTFVFVGSFTPDAIRPFVETYVASLPARTPHETWRDVGIAPPAGIVEKTIEKGIAPKSQVAIVFSGPFEYDATNRLALRTVTLLLQSRLFDTIRQELGGTYSITVTPDMQKVPRQEYQVRIEWTCDPAQTTSLVQRVLREVEFVRGARIPDDRMPLVRQGLVREYETNSQSNGYLLNQIARRYEDGEAGTADDVQARIAALTSDQIFQAAQRYLTLDRYVKVVLMPEH